MTNRIFVNRSHLMQRWRERAIPAWKMARRRTQINADFSFSSAGAATPRPAWGTVLSLLILLALPLLAAGCRGKVLDPAASQTQPAPSGLVTAVKLMTDADGVYTAPVAALRAAGFDLATVSPETFSLTRDGRPVAFQVVGQGKNRALRFYGQAPARTAYTGRSIYWLAPAGTGAASPAAIAGRTAAPAGAAAADVAPTTIVSATVRAEEQKHYDGMAAAGDDRWLWQPIFAPAEIQASLQAPHAAAGEATLRLRLVANSSAPVDPDHHLIVSVNGAQIADEKWDGAGPHVITATVPSGIVRPGENTVTLKAPGDTGAPADSSVLDWIELTYPRELVMDEGELAFAGQAEAYDLAVPGELAVLWDITDPAAPVALSDYERQGGRVRFASDGTLRRFLAATAAGLRQPAAITSVAGEDLRALPGGADLIIVTAPQFRAALEPLVAARQKQGLRVAVVDVDQIYDAFSHGEPGPEAIRAFVQYARMQWPAPAPRYLLLAGDASYDPRGSLGGTELDLVPTQLVRTAFSGWTASDVWYALPDDGATSLPVLPVGRLPSQTPEQLATMVAKTLEYEKVDSAATWRHDALVVADNDEPGFAEAAKAFSDQLTGYQARAITVEGDGSGTREELAQAFAQGTGLLGYFGHGSVELWAQEKILAVEAVAKLTNREKLPIVFTVTCLSGLFQHPIKPSLGETLVRAKNGGAVAALVPSSAAVLPDQRVLAQGLAAALGAAAGTDGPRTLGDAVLAAQQSLTNAAGGVRDVLLTFNLLGDPTLPLAR
jgi:hypothetical protein